MQCGFAKGSSENRDDGGPLLGRVVLDAGFEFPQAEVGPPEGDAGAARSLLIAELAIAVAVAGDGSDVGLQGSHVIPGPLGEIAQAEPVYRQGAAVAAEAAETKRARQALGDDLEARVVTRITEQGLVSDIRSVAVRRRQHITGREHIGPRAHRLPRHLRIDQAKNALEMATQQARAQSVSLCAYPPPRGGAAVAAVAGGSTHCLSIPRSLGAPGGIPDYHPSPRRGGNPFLASSH